MHKFITIHCCPCFTTLVKYRQLNSACCPPASPIYNGPKPSTYTKSRVTEFLLQPLNIMWETQEQKEVYCICLWSSLTLINGHVPFEKITFSAECGGTCLQSQNFGGRGGRIKNERLVSLHCESESSLGYRKSYLK